VGALDDARAHLAKAREFHEAAQITLDLEMLNAATSAAVSSGINSKDAICLHLTGTSSKTENHAQAITELTRSGPDGSAVAQTFSRLLRLKPISQYQAGSVARTDAERAVDWADRMLEAATRVVRS
jgi:hypothetical protein